MNPQTAALITGASMGIGAEFAKIYAERGHNLVLVARSLDKLEVLADQLQREHSIKVVTIAADLSKIEEVAKIPGEIEQIGIKIGVLVNNAGFGEYGYFTETAWEKELQMINLNITALTYLTKHYAQDMARRGQGRICNVASTAAFQPGPKMAVYFATKAYVLSLSEAVAEELQGTGVTITTLCPGATTSNFAENANASSAGIFKNRALPTAREVALFGVESTQEGKRVAIHGLLNKIMVESVRLTPRNLVTKIARQIL